jgi:hypothetical protein
VRFDSEPVVEAIDAYHRKRTRTGAGRAGAGVPPKKKVAAKKVAAKRK